MLKKNFTFLLLLLFACSVRSQNLLSNGGFETYSTLPLNYGDFCMVSGWINPSGCCVLNPNYGTPDYINRNAAWPVGVPSNGFGTVTPHSGDGAVGFTTYGNYGTPPVFREYICKKLDTHMNIGQSYTVAFYLMRAAAPFFKYATNNIGVYLSVNQPVQSGTAVMPVTPNWEYTSVFSSSTWTLMSFNIIPTDTFSYITIGNFRSDAATTKSTINASASGVYSHYFIDDVSVTTSAMLPVEMLSFDAAWHSPVVEVGWSTASELQNDYFILERSTDMLSFAEITRISGAGTSHDTRHYRATDFSPPSGQLYYRLKQVDLDGSTSVAGLQTISTSGSQSEHAWYQSATKSIISVNGSGVTVPVYVYSSGGSVVGVFEIAPYSSAEFDASTLPAGLYVISQPGKNSRLAVY